jgi:cytochrome c
MKRHFLTFAVIAFALATEPALAGKEEDFARLSKASGCTACHAMDAKFIGPSWKDIASRYKDDPHARAMLIEKVKKGSRGAWDDVTGGVPMPPYSPRVSEADIEQLVDYILGL